MTEFTDPRDLGGDVAGPGGPHDRGAFLIDTAKALLLDYHTVVRLDTSDESEFIAALLLEGRVNKTPDRAKVLVLTNEDGIAAIISELIALLGRAGGQFLARLDERLAALHRDGLDQP
jgi:hypothetical protein